MEIQGAIPPPVLRRWSERNWKWVVPVSIAGAVTVLACFAGLILLFVSGTFKRSDPYIDALAHARSNPAVLHELGEPIQPGWWVIGSMNITGPTGAADFETSLRGPLGRGTLYVSARKQAGQWQFRIVQVAVEGKRERIDLLSDRNGV